MARQLFIQVSGTDVNGRDFVSPGKTLLLSQFGAKILVAKELAPEQEINISCAGIMRREGARVVKLCEKESSGYAYGIEFQRAATDHWKTRFPPA
jgi:hypothetical protein